MPGPGEPLWLDEDATKALAYLRYRRSFCPDCGEDRTDWLDDNGKELLDPPKGIVSVLCPSCEMIEDERADRSEPGHPMHGKHGIKLAFRRLTDLDDPDDAASF